METRVGILISALGCFRGPSFISDRCSHVGISWDFRVKCIILYSVLPGTDRRAHASHSRCSLFEFEFFFLLVPEANMLTSSMNPSAVVAVPGH